VKFALLAQEICSRRSTTPKRPPGDIDRPTKMADAEDPDVFVGSFTATEEAIFALLGIRPAELVTPIKAPPAAPPSPSPPATDERARVVAAIQIQAWWRMAVCHRHWRRLQQVVALVQLRWRAITRYRLAMEWARAAEQRRLAMLGETAAVIQRWWRRVLDVRRQRQKIEAAATETSPVVVEALELPTAALDGISSKLQTLQEIRRKRLLLQQQLAQSGVAVPDMEVADAVGDPKTGPDAAQTTMLVGSAGYTPVEPRRSQRRHSISAEMSKMLLQQRTATATPGAQPCTMPSVAISNMTDDVTVR